MPGGDKKESDIQKPLQDLKNRKKIFLENIRRIKVSIQDKTISCNAIELECRLDILNKYIGQVMTVQDDIDTIELDFKQRTELENLCVSTKSLLLGLLQEVKKSNASETSIVVQERKSKLPHMKLPKFSGKYSEFKNFISLFENLVHNVNSLSNIEKFNHLISCLSDEALGTVKAFQITDDNYPKALASLKRVYDNKCLIFFDTISQLFDLPQSKTPSASALRSIVDTVSAVYDSLLSIGDDKNISNAILIHLVMSKVDQVTRSKWEEQMDYNELPLWSDCQTMLNKRFQHMSAEESSASTHNKNQYQKNNIGPRRNHKSAFTVSKSHQNSEVKCHYCKSLEHAIQYCTSFSALPITNRFDFAKSVPLCINCLRKGHSVTYCKSPKCRVCSRPHHTLLHKYQNETNTIISRNTASDAEAPSTSSQASASVNYATDFKDQVVLATALVKVRCNTGEYVLARALLDSGSQVNCITEELAQTLRLKKEQNYTKLVGIGKTNATIQHKVTTSVSSRVNTFQFVTDFLILRSISTFHPDHALPCDQWDIPPNIELADPNFFKPQRIDLLLGAETFFEMMCVGQIKSNASRPTLQKTLLGWIISGKYSSQTQGSIGVCNFASSIDDGSSLDSVVKKFWELEELPSDITCTKLTQDHQLCERNFLQTVKRLPSGRFSVSLPFKSDPSTLGLSFDTAKRRFLSLERKLLKNSDMRQLYMDFMNEYLSLGHMSLTKSEIPKIPHYYIPHQCVLRPHSTSTKLRVVFDASSKSSSNVSLNDTLLVGPTVQNDLYTILLRFRLHKYAVTADITKMYRQIEIDEADRSFQLILWREKENDPIKTYKLNTVTYGTSPAPFLAIRCLTYLSELYKNSHPVGSEVIKNDFYVDDLLTGAENTQDLDRVRKEVSDILNSAGFSLAKWHSNHTSYCNQSEEMILQFNDTDSTKTLGITWSPKEDNFQFILESNFNDMPATKRNILSISSRLFDPLGLLSPIIIRAKILLQELWLSNLDWDESIPMSLDTIWENFKNDLLLLNSISIPRYVHTSSQRIIEIHGFADASIRAYGCCIYVRTRNGNDVISRLLTAKSRVAPLKTKSLPRLELCAAHLLAKLWIKIQPMLMFKINAITHWTDSEITLHWLKTHPSSLATFVANRVAEIQEWSQNVAWRHVPSKSNPADIVSRGCSIAELKNSIWFNGPEFLLQDPSRWPHNSHFQLSREELSLEKRKTNVVLTSHEEENPFLNLIEKHSSLTKLLRIFAYILRFARKKSKESTDSAVKNYKIPAARELKLSFFKIIEIIQKFFFGPEIKKLKSCKPLLPCYQKLNPFMHEFVEQGISFSLIRVGGRLLNAPIAYDAKFPLLLPKASPFVTKYLGHLHIKNFHAGAKVLVGLSRQEIWLINAREACSKIIRNCVHCFRYKPKLMTQIMGNLPPERLRAMRPFLICGVDFCGPINITLKIRGRPPTKMYIAVFVCFTSKAVHLELVSDLTADCFIFCLKRFIGRRGLPKKVFCDNATNFVGADRKLRDLAEAFHQQKETLISYTAEQGMEFAFIPPRAPHFGGLWEAAVKSAKHLLVKAIGNAVLTTEEMTTVIIEVEAILNSRPITPLSHDPSDGEALTPAHLLVGETLRSLPPESVPETPDNKLPLLKRWQLLSVLKRKFWRAWSRDFILSLQQRNKWDISQPDLEIGKLVLIHDDNLRPQQWLTGRVIDVMPGSDSRVRVADVRTKDGIFRRPISRLALLPHV